MIWGIKWRRRSGWKRGTGGRGRKTQTESRISGWFQDKVVSPHRIQGLALKLLLTASLQTKQASAIGFLCKMA